jgi:hypothetical protein
MAGKLTLGTIGIQDMYVIGEPNLFSFLDYF